MENIRPIRRPSVGEMVSDQLKEFLLDGRWKPGEKIPSENELAKSFGVSRVTIREALLRLASLGLLESRFGGGTYVREITPGLNMNALVPAAYLDPRSLLEVIEFRHVMETKTAALAARRATPEDVAELESTLARMERAGDDPGRFASEDLEFHLQLAKITKNSLIIESMNVIKGLLGQALARTIERQGRSRVLPFHRRIVNAVAAHDEEAAILAMDQHIENMYESMERQLKTEKKGKAGTGKARK